MTSTTAKTHINHTGAFSLQEKRHLRTAIDTIYSDTGGDYSALTTPATAGITGGAGALCYSAVRTIAGSIPLIVTTIFVDITDLQSSTTDLDIIGQSTPAAHLGRITTAQNGVIFSGKMSCLEVPAVGVTTIDLYSATVGTGKFDDGIAALTETALVTAAGAWVAGQSVLFSAGPPADGYLYLCNGAAGTVGTYTTGKFIIELYGTSL